MAIFITVRKIINMIRINRFEGLIAAPFTPMDKKGIINYDIIPGYYDLLEKNGVTGAFINGSTGECASLTSKERQLQAEAWSSCHRAGGKVRIINMIGGTSYQECIDHALLSSENAIEAVAIVAPYYFKPSSEDALAEFCTRVGEAVPCMPVYFYHIPVLTGVNLSMFTFIRKISDMLPNFAGIKFTHEDMMDFQLCLNYKDGAYNLLWGRDECLLSALATGCRGAVGSTFNYAAPLYLKLIEVFNSGDIAEARRLQNLSIEIVRLLGKYGGMGTGKAFMKYIGLDCGSFRSPVSNMEKSLYASFVKDVEGLGAEEVFSKL